MRNNRSLRKLRQQRSVPNGHGTESEIWSQPERWRKAEMNMPGFAAEASLCEMSGHYYTARVGTPADNAVYPAVFVDPVCYSKCHFWCGPDCQDLSGADKGRCLRECAA